MSPSTRVLLSAAGVVTVIALWSAGTDEPTFGDAGNAVGDVVPSDVEPMRLGEALRVDVVLPASPPPATTPNADGTPVCGLGTIPVTQDTDADMERFEALTRPLVDAQRRHVLASMLASGDERTVAAAHFFLAMSATIVPSITGCKEGAVECPETAAAADEARVHRERLATMARGARDPQVYAWAMQACQSVPNDGSCVHLSDAQWARLDPGNAVPWEWAAARAKDAKDAAAVAEAMHRFGTSTRHDIGWGALSSMLVDHLPPGQDPDIATYDLVMRAVGFETLATLGHMQGVSSWCGATALSDANRRSACDRIATMLTERSTTLLAQGVGTGIAKRLDWPQPRMQRLLDERDAIYATWEDVRDSKPFTCNSIAIQIQGIRDSTQLGEIEHGRRRIEATGRSVAELARQHQKWRSAMSAAHAASAATPSNAASAPASP